MRIPARVAPGGWVAPFGDPGITDRSHLPRAFRSVPRPSSPLSAKASTKCPYLALDPLKNTAAHNGKTPSGPPPRGARNRNPRRSQSPAAGRHNSLFTNSISKNLASREPPPSQAPSSGAQGRRPVEVIGIEPTPSCLQSRRSPN
jgi:hypothetical protein